MSISKTGELRIRLVDCINVNFLMLVLYYSFARCCQWGKLGKVCVRRGPFCAISYNCT